MVKKLTGREQHTGIQPVEYDKMKDNMTATPEQKTELIVQALGIAGFTENTEYPGVFTQELGMKKIVKDLNIGRKTYFLVDKKTVTEDDEHNTLAKVDKMITEAEDGMMPTKTDADIIVNIGGKGGAEKQSDDLPSQPETAQKNGIDFNVDPDTWPEGWDPSMDARPKESIEHAPATMVHSTAPPAPFVPQGTMIKGFVPGLKEIGKNSYQDLKKLVKSR